MNAKAAKKLRKSLIINPNRTLLLSGQFGENDADEIVAKIFDFGKDIRKNIYLQINSKGGSYVGGMKIYDAIKNCRSQVIGIVIGDAFSMAGVVLQACKYRAATRNSRLLFHNVALDISLTIQPNSEIEDFTTKIQNEIDEVIRKNEIVKQVLSERGSGEIGDMDIFLQSERILPAKRALLLNFIDEII